MEPLIIYPVENMGNLIERPLWSGNAKTRVTIDDSLPIIKNWIHDCETAHPECKSQKDVPILPTRVLDVGTAESEDCYLRQPGGEMAHYAALSHCWGKTKPLSTTTETLAERLKGIPFNTLPKAFRDAVVLTRKLGIRYVWIDSLCIIQDDTRDWEHEAARMGDIYQDAYITIAATVAHGSDEGFLRPEKPARRMFFPALKQHGYSGLAYVRMEASDYYMSHWSPLAQRAWVFQELVLSRRLIHFTEDQIFWQCAHWTTSEDGVAKYFYSKESGSGNIHYEERALGPGLKHTLAKDSLAIEDFRGCWWAGVENYSSRKLTYPSDRVPAFLAVTKLFQNMTGDIPLAGLWKNDFCVGLLWTVKLNSDGAPPLRFSNVPSWSWFSIDAPLRGHEFSEHKVPVPRLELLEAKVTWEREPLVSPMVGGKAVVRGRLKKMYLGFVLKGTSLDVDHVCLRMELTRNSEESQIVVVGRCTLDDPSRIIDHEIWCLDVTEHRTWLYVEGRNVRCIVHSVLILERTGGDANEYRRLGCGNVNYEYDFEDIQPQTITLI